VFCNGFKWDIGNGMGEEQCKVSGLERVECVLWVYGLQ
jgi:hypothetical protein